MPTQTLTANVIQRKRPSHDEIVNFFYNTQKVPKDAKITMTDSQMNPHVYDDWRDTPVFDGQYNWRIFLTVIVPE